MANIVVAGSGAIGAFLAYALAKRGARGIVLCDRGRLVGGSTGSAMGGVRQQFSTASEVKLTRRSIGFFESVGPPLFEQRGYLFVAATEQGFEELRSRAALQRSLGVPVEVVDRGRIAALAPGLETNDLKGGVFCAKDGLADPPALTREILTRARGLGVEIREFEDARTIPAAVVVIASGAESRDLAVHYGIELPIRPLVRQLFETHTLAGLSEHLPMVVESETGFHFRRRGACLRVAMGDEVPRWQSSPEVDASVLPDRLARLARRFPPAAGTGVERAWAGLYDMTPDAHPILDRAGERVFLACGFSGHGFMQAPAVGESMAEWILGGERPEEFSPFSLDRFRDGGAAAEAVVL